MRVRETCLFATVLVVAGLVSVETVSRQVPPPSSPFTSEFNLGQCHLVPNGRNRYFSLQPGHMLRLEGDDEGEFVEVEIRVLDITFPIMLMLNGQPTVVVTRVVREREWVDGELVETSFNYFARDTKTGNIFYFGEHVNLFDNGVIVGHDGSWKAGVGGAMPGLIMPSTFLLGARYFQEIAPGVAMDRAKHVEMGLDVTTPAGTFHNCVRVVETSPLEPGDVSEKIYAPGVGLIVDDAVELVSFSD